LLCQAEVRLLGVKSWRGGEDEGEAGGTRRLTHFTGHKKQSIMENTSSKPCGLPTPATRHPSMNRLPPTIVALAMLTLLPALGWARGDLSRYRGRNRVLLVFAPSAADARLRRQNALLAGGGARMADRDLVRVNVLGGDRGRAGLYARYGVRPDQFRALLIGKDGHVVFGSSSPPALADITARIDRMPMRRDEIRRRGKR